MCLWEEAVAIAGHVQDMRELFGSSGRQHCRCQYDHIDRHLYLPAEFGAFGMDDQRAIVAWQDLPRPRKGRNLSLNPLMRLLLALCERRMSTWNPTTSAYVSHVSNAPA